MKIHITHSLSKDGLTLKVLRTAKTVTYVCVSTPDERCANRYDTKTSYEYTVPGVIYDSAIPHHAVGVEIDEATGERRVRGFVQSYSVQCDEVTGEVTSTLRFESTEIGD